MAVTGTPPAHVVLVELPFRSPFSPSLGLARLHAALRSHNVPAMTAFTNERFACAIGVREYRWIAEFLPHEVLLGDFAFAHIVNGGERSTPDLTDSQRAFLAEHGVPFRALERLEDIRRRATVFIAELADEFVRSDPSIVGISTSYQLTPALALARAVKDRNSHIALVLGGAQCTGTMGWAIHKYFECVDYVCSGEGEVLLPKLAKCIRDGHLRDLASIPGLIYREKGESILAGAPEPVTDLDELPSPVFQDWFRCLRDSAMAVDTADLSLPFETSRGCWWAKKSQCLFCGLNAQNESYRRRQAATVYADLQRIAEYGINRAIAVDTILDPGRFLDLFPMLAERPLPLHIAVETRSNLSREQVRLMREAGVVQIQPGIESLSAPILRLMRKGVTPLENLRLLKWTAEHGIACSWNLLYGFPNEPPEEYARMAQLIPAVIHLQPPTFGCRRVRVVRFSPLYERHKDHGISRLWPAEAYSLVLGLHEAAIEDIALYFDWKTGDHRDPSYVVPLRAAVDHWRKSIGSKSLTIIHRNRRRVDIVDRRSALRSRHVQLEGQRMAAYLACEGGASISEVAAQLGESVRCTSGILDEFLREEWILKLGDEYLGVAVNATDIVPADVPESLLPAAAHALYCARMQKLTSFK